LKAFRFPKLTGNNFDEKYLRDNNADDTQVGPKERGINDHTDRSKKH